MRTTIRLRKDAGTVPFYGAVHWAVVAAMWRAARKLRTKRYRAAVQAYENSDAGWAMLYAPRD